MVYYVNSLWHYSLLCCVDVFCSLKKQNKNQKKCMHTVRSCRWWDLWGFVLGVELHVLWCQSLSHLNYLALVLLPRYFVSISAVCFMSCTLHLGFAICPAFKVYITAEQISLWALLKPLSCLVTCSRLRLLKISQFWLAGCRSRHCVLTEMFF